MRETHLCNFFFLRLCFSTAVLWLNADANLVWHFSMLTLAISKKHKVQLRLRGMSLILVINQSTGQINILTWWWRLIKMLLCRFILRGCVPNFLAIHPIVEILPFRPMWWTDRWMDRHCRAANMAKNELLRVWGSVNEWKYCSPVVKESDTSALLLCTCK